MSRIIFLIVFMLAGFGIGTFFDQEGAGLVIGLGVGLVLQLIVNVSKNNVSRDMLKRIEEIENER